MTTELKDLLTELQNAREALSWSEAKFQAVFNQAPFSIQIFDLNGKVLLFNKAAQALWEIPDEFVTNFIMKEYNVLEDPLLIEQGLVDIIRRTFAGEIVKLPIVRYDPSTRGLPGRHRWVDPLLFPLRDLNGVVREVVLVHDDITERHEAEEARKALLQELVKERNHLESFISIASHELKTPLTSLNLQMEVIRNLVTTPKAELDREALIRVSKSSLRQIEKLGKHVEEMLDISRISAGKLYVNLQLVDLSALVKEIDDRFSEQFKLYKIPVSCSVEDNIFVYGDPFRLEQVITNLLSNAIRYGNQSPVEIGLRAVDSDAEIRVKDSGPGIDKKYHEKIFERFQRVEATEKVGGLGLGLYICQEIMKEIKGSIFVESELGSGATFIVKVPRQLL